MNASSEVRYPETFPSGTLPSDFLCNLLASFLALNRLNERLKLEEGFLALSRVIYYMEGRDTHTELKNEFSFLDSYLSLEKIRFGDRLSYRLCLDRKMSDLRIERYGLFNNVCQMLQVGDLESIPGNRELICRTAEDNAIEVVVVVDGVRSSEQVHF
jgi:LytS/YehU family sensor histidine kinase